MMGCGSWDAPCGVLEVCTAGTESATRELDPTARVGSLNDSVETVARRALAEVPVAPRGILGAAFWIFVVER